MKIVNKSYLKRQDMPTFIPIFIFLQVSLLFITDCELLNSLESQSIHQIG